MVNSDTIGTFVDKISSEAGVPQRTAPAVAGRLIEEVVELCLAAGLGPDKIMSHVMDSIHNQVGKAGRRAGRVIYPSQYKEDATIEELGEEMADCSLVLKDLAYITGVNVGMEEDVKWAAFTKRKFAVSPQGTLYAIK
jgi:hypothetical protein